MKNEEPTTTRESHSAIPFPGDLRDWFAGQALVGTLALQAGRQLANNTLDIRPLVDQVYLLADAMLEARKK